MSITSFHLTHGTGTRRGCGIVVLDNPLDLESKNKKAQLTQGLRATAPSFQDGGCSKMAVSRHLGYYRTGISAIRSADPVNPWLEPDMEWIGRTDCEIFAFKLYCDLETGVRGHSRSSKTAPFDRADTTLYSSSIVTAYISYRFRDIAAVTLVENRYTPCIWRPRWGWRPQIYTTTLGVGKLEWWAYRTVKEFRWYVQPFWYNTRVWRTDRQTDGRNWRGIYAL